MIGVGVIVIINTFQQAVLAENSPARLQYNERNQGEKNMDLSGMNKYVIGRERKQEGKRF